jgi:hypothetical protein
MAKLESELAYFRIRLGQQFVADVASGRPIPADAIRQEVQTGPFGNMSIADREFAIRELEQNFTTSQKRGSTVKSDYRPWLHARREAMDFYYWNRLKQYYLQGNVLPPQVVATLDSVTDEVLDYIGNPADERPWSRRGMVMGHVQSGKTTNYSSLICKAADAGYKVIILLAGITNSLRTQTQERLDETFIGKKSVFNAAASEPLPLQNYAVRRRFPAYGTSRDRDFTKDAAGVFFHLAALNEPTIFVTKKNKSVLERLKEWIAEQTNGQPVSFPLLLIDDEADNASINTAKDPMKTTAINGVIREILSMFERSSYVGYTATPFANIFIDPDTDSSMLKDDLFPRHFIKALDPPSNYVGAHRVFAANGDLRKSHVVVVKDFPTVLDLSHKREHPVSKLPNSLYEAIRAYCLTRAVRVIRAQGNKHCTMMINVSRFNDVQEKVLGHVYTYLVELKNSIEMNAGISMEKITDANIDALKVTFEKEYSSIGIEFAEVLGVLPEAVRNVTALTVNMKGGSLDYSRHKATGLHVIAVGGLALSRGLTLEGLTISYILRNTEAADTLMQMARWFGYRPGFEDICRVYLSQTSLDHYVYINDAMEELRAEIKRMERLGATPQDFGLRVRQSELALRITAANKMRTAKEWTGAQDYSGRHIEGYALVNNAEINNENREVAIEFASRLGKASDDFPKDLALIWAKVSGVEVLRLLKKFVFADAHPDLGQIMTGRSLFMDYVSDRMQSELKEWDVAIPKLIGSGPFAIGGASIKVRSRNSGTVDAKGVFRVTGKKNRVADPNDAQFALSEPDKDAARAEKEKDDGPKGDRAFCLKRQRPLLLIHIFSSEGLASITPPVVEATGIEIAAVNDAVVEKLNFEGQIVSLSFCMPSTNVPSESHTYQVNKVYVRQLELAMETDDDEQLIEDPDRA